MYNLKNAKNARKVHMVTKTKYDKRVDDFVEINGLLIPFGVNFYEVHKLPNDKELFTDKVDALFSRLLFRIKSGVPLSNYVTSKYYKIYVERLQKDYPELLV